ncbi:MAG: hypothetical protein ABS949_05205 [Solibacillus sp.]
MVSDSEKLLLELKSRFEKTFSNLPLSIVTRNMAIVEAEEHPLQFEFVSNTIVDTEKQQITTYINEIDGTIPGIITLGTSNIISQHIRLTCEFEILSIALHSLEQLLKSTNPVLTYSEWLLEAIENEILLLEVKTDDGTVIDFPVGIKNADFL